MSALTDKLASRGVQSLSDEQLLELLVDDPVIASELSKMVDGKLQNLSTCETSRLRMVGGMGLKCARRVVAAVELGRRVSIAKAQETDAISSSEDVISIFRPQLQHLSFEECWVLYLTSSNRVVERQRVSQGGVQATIVDHKLIVKRALELLVPQIIMVHNHPSGSAQPSEQDKILTEKIKRAAQLFDIALLDHLIISREGEFSFRRAGLL